MIGPDDFNRIMETAAAGDEWWLEQGVDPEILHAWCLAQAAEDLDLMAAEGQGHRKQPITAARLGGHLATAYHMGLHMGWRLATERGT